MKEKERAKSEGLRNEPKEIMKTMQKKKKINKWEWRIKKQGILQWETKT